MREWFLALSIAPRNQKLWTRFHSFTFSLSLSFLVPSCLIPGGVVCAYYPITAVPSVQWANHVCANCLHLSYPRKIREKCPDCQVASYCSSACQVQASSRYHSPDTCRGLKDLSDHRLWLEKGWDGCDWKDTLASLLLVFITQPLTQASLDAVNSLCTLDSCVMREDLHEAFQEIILDVTACLPHQSMATITSLLSQDDDGNGGPPFTIPAFLYDTLLRWECNTFSLWDDQYSQYALCLFREASMFNHSCHPNLCKVPEPDGNGCFRLVFRAIRSIALQEELLLCYVPANGCTKERQMTLREHFGFQCTCPRCSAVTSDEGNGAVLVPDYVHDECGGLWYPLESIESVVGKKEPVIVRRQRCSICREEKSVHI